MSALDDLVNIENLDLQDYKWHYTNHYVCRMDFPEPDEVAAELASLRSRLAELEAAREEAEHIIKDYVEPLDDYEKHKRAWEWLAKYTPEAGNHWRIPSAPVERKDE